MNTRLMLLQGMFIQKGWKPVPFFGMGTHEAEEWSGTMTDVFGESVFTVTEHTDLMLSFNKEYKADKTKPQIVYELSKCKWYWEGTWKFADGQDSGTVTAIITSVPIECLQQFENKLFLF